MNELLFPNRLRELHLFAGDSGDKCSIESSTALASGQLPEAKQMGEPVNCTSSELSIYLAALAEGYLATSCLDTNPSAPLKSNPIASKSYTQGSKTVSFRGFPYLQMSKSSMENLGGELLMSSQGGSHAKTLVQPEKGLESKDQNQDYGRKCGGSLARLCQFTFLWRTHQCSLFEEGTEFLLTWPQWAMWDEAECWEQTTPYGIRELRQRIMKGRESGLSEKIPTPTVFGNYNRKGASKTSGDGFATYIKRYPTPTSHMSKEGNFPSEINRQTPTMGAVLGGPPNPEFIEWLMGWPIGWTDLKPLEMDRFRQWRNSHGRFSMIPDDAGRA